jgi:hypothetical protein
MSEGMIKFVFLILGTLLVGMIMFTILFGTAGQQMMWNAIEPAMLEKWRQSTMDNGAERTLIYERQFDEMETVKYNG